MANSVPGNAAAAVTEEAETPPEPSAPAKRRYEIVRGQDGEQFDSAQSSKQMSALEAESPLFVPFGGLRNRTENLFLNQSPPFRLQSPFCHIRPLSRTFA